MPGQPESPTCHKLQRFRDKPWNQTVGATVQNAVHQRRRVAREVSNNRPGSWNRDQSTRSIRTTSTTS